jgi:hypothetical protein|tara:strand:+ start:35 stop:217 length:183 start_codon:yes stop_codon:yes gene_type:complete
MAHSLVTTGKAKWVLNYLGSPLGDTAAGVYWLMSSLLIVIQSRYSSFISGNKKALPEGKA